MANAFTLNGSTNSLTGNASPSSLLNNSTNYGGLLGSSTPQAKALSTAVTPTNNYSSLSGNASVAPAIKSQKVTETTYHPPADTSTPSFPNTGTSAGVLNTGPAVPQRVQEINDTIAKTGGIAPSAQNAPNAGMMNSQGQPVPTAPQQTPYQQATSGLLNIGQNGSQAVNDANKALTDFRTSLADKQAAIGNTGADLNFKQGEQQVLQQAGATKEAALEAGVTNALANQGQQITANQNAGTLTSPVQVPYSNQFINPLTGSPINGGQAGQLPTDAQNVVNTYAQQVKKGFMTRADAESKLSAYGVAGTNALAEALGPDFNTNASNASAGTTAVGQQIKTAADSTNQALDSLVQNFNSLPGVQTGGIPLTNSIAQWIGTNLGSQALAAYKTNLADARSQLIGVLNSSGGTPTGNESTADQYLPDNMTKAQFDANVGTTQNPGIVRQLIAQKVGSFITSGNQNNSSTSTSGSGGWDSLGD